MVSTRVKISMGLIKAIVYTYEFITYPIYAIFRKTLSYTPLNTSNTNIDIKYDPEEKKILALSVRKDDPSSPWRSLEAMEKLATQAAPNCITACDLWLRSVALYNKSNAFGTRRINSIFYETIPSGKKFIKAILGEYTWETFEEVENRISCLAAGLYKLLETNNSSPIAIYSETRTEWFLSMQAIFRLNTSVVTLYATLGEEALIHGINETEASVLFISHELLEKVPRVIAKCPKIKYVIYFSNGIYYYQNNETDRIPEIFKDDLNKCKSELGDKIIDIVEVESIGKDVISRTKQDLRRNQSYQGKWMIPETRDIDPNDLAFIMYTSGSTGVPKGVEISHKNISSAVAGFVNRLPPLRSDIDIYIGYLPLAHVFELACELTCCFMGVSIGYGNSQTLVDTATRIKTGSCKGDLKQLEPTLFSFVPTVVERIAKAVYEKINTDGEFATQLFNFAFSYKKRRIMAGYPSFLVDRFVFRKTRALLGGKLRYIISGGAPLSEDSQWFTNICLAPVIQGYGLTETTSSCALMETGDLRTTIVGAPLSSVEIKLRAWTEGGYAPTDKPNPRGEVLIGGDIVTRGYFKKPDLTAKDFIVDTDGKRWFCTGDIGMIHIDGSISIIDRKKDLVKLQAGEYVSLARVELILAQNSFVETICVYADSKFSFVVAFISPKVKRIRDMAEESGFMPSHEEIIKAMNDSGDSREKSIHQLLCKNEKVISTVLQDLQKFGREKKLNSFEVPQKIALDNIPWTPETGLVTDAFKLKRFNIKERFQSSIDQFYSTKS